MRKKRMFVASSGRSAPLARALQFHLQGSVDVQIWERDTFAPSTETLQSLLDACKEVDFFAVLLTPDDPTEQRGEAKIVPRDNCIFELGLFMGGLGLQPERCFMIASVDRDDVPSDLAGRTFVHFEQPGQLTPAACREALKDAAVMIQGVMDEKGVYVRPEFTYVDAAVLMAYEQLKSITPGQLQDGSEVIVRTGQPIESDGEFADHALGNMKTGVRYMYFLRESQNHSVTSKFLQTLATAGLGGKNTADRRRLTKEKKEDVIKNLELLKESMTICILPHGPFDFCIHNADSELFAKCYMRKHLEGKFVTWLEKDRAYDTAEDIKVNYIEPPEGPTSSIFQSTNAFKLEENGNGEKIWQRLKQEFDPAIHAELRKYCFGQTPVGAAAGN